MNVVNNQLLVIHLRARLSAISSRCSQIVAKMSDEEILNRYADHKQEQKDQAGRWSKPLALVTR
jgi:hypothetical protein